MTDSAATAVVCSRDGGSMLHTALASMGEALGPSDTAVVIDSASKTDGVADAAHSAGIECVRVDRPGLSRARNAAIRHAGTEIVAFTDDDCRPARDWLARIRTHFVDPQVAFVTGRVTASKEVGTAASTLERLEPARYEGIVDPYGIGHGANMAFRRSVLLDLGGFDEALGAGTRLRSAEDADMLYRCLAAGWAGIYDPEAVVTHEQWRERGQLIRLRYGYGLGNGAFRVKAARCTRRPGLVLLLRSLWHQGLRPTLRAVRPSRLRALPGTASWTAGMFVGMVRGALMPLDGHNFARGTECSRPKVPSRLGERESSLASPRAQPMQEHWRASRTPPGEDSQPPNAAVIEDGSTER